MLRNDTERPMTDNTAHHHELDDAQLDEATGGMQVVRMRLKCNSCGFMWMTGGNASQLVNRPKCPRCQSSNVSTISREQWEFV